MRAKGALEGSLRCQIKEEMREYKETSFLFFNYELHRQHAYIPVYTQIDFEYTRTHSTDCHVDTQRNFPSLCASPEGEEGIRIQ